MLKNFKECFSINLNDYSNIGINLQINKVLIPTFIVFGALMVLLAIYRNNMRAMIVQLMRHEALNEEKSVTLEELGLYENRVVKYLLGRSNMLTKTVECIGKTKYSYEEYKALNSKERKECEKIDFTTEKFFIPEEQIDRARHIKEKYHTTKTAMILWCVFLFLFYIALAAAMPEILNVINNLLN